MPDKPSTLFDVAYGFLRDPAMRTHLLPEYAHGHVVALLDGIDERDKEIERLRAELRWISVGERLPEKDVAVLAWHEGRHQLAYYDDAEWVSESLTGYVDRLYNVSHWRPLPPGPEE